MKKILGVALLVAGAFALAQTGNDNVGTIGKNFFSIDFPLTGVTDTEATALTPSGMIVGRYFTPDQNEHGFTLIKGQFQSIDVPGATSTDAAWVNFRGDIVGGCNCNGMSPAYVLRAGRFTTITGTESNGIDPQDNVVGRYYTTDGHTHGYFLAHVQ